MRPQFQLYSRLYCHLCQDVILALEAARVSHAFDYSVVDVDSSPELEARFGEWVPVLMDGDREIFHYHFDASQLDAALQDRGFGANS